jgi:hypothetical protein
MQGQGINTKFKNSKQMAGQVAGTPAFGFLQALNSGHMVTDFAGIVTGGGQAPNVLC